VVVGVVVRGLAAVGEGVHEGEEAFQRQHVDCVQGAADGKGVLRVGACEREGKPNGARQSAKHFCALDGVQQQQEEEEEGGGGGRRRRRRVSCARRRREGGTYFVEEFAELLEEVCALEIAVVVEEEVDHEIGLRAELHQALESQFLLLVARRLALHDTGTAHAHAHAHQNRKESTAFVNQGYRRRPRRGRRPRYLLRRHRKKASICSLRDAL
jgi:hypothetical protein